MADETYILPEELVYQEAIRKIQNSDPVDAELIINPLIQALIGNTEFVRQLAMAIAQQNAAEHTAIRQETAQSIQQNAADHTAIRQETAQSIQEAVAAIPTPDVSGQIGNHDTDASAHEARFQALDDKFAPAGHSHSAADVGAAPSGHTHTAADVGAAPSEHTHSAADVGASPSGHTHTAADVGASPSGHTHTAAQVGASPSGHKHTKGEITDFPASLPASDVSAWAKKSTKPTYTASEVGAAPSGHTHSAADVGAAASNHTHTAAAVGAAPSNHTHTAAQVGAATTAYVDSAIQGKSEFVTIVTGTNGTLAHATRTYPVTDWGSYSIVCVDIQTPSGYNYIFKCNGQSGAFWYGGNVEYSKGVSYLHGDVKARLIFFPMRSPNASVSCVQLCTLPGFGFISGLTYNNLKTFEITPEGATAFGSAIPVTITAIK